MSRKRSKLWSRIGGSREWVNAIGDRIYDRGPTKPKGGRGENGVPAGVRIPAGLYRETRFVLELTDGRRRVCESRAEAERLREILRSEVPA